MKPEKYYFEDDNIFPNSKLPALLYKGILDIPFFVSGKPCARYIQQEQLG